MKKFFLLFLVAFSISNAEAKKSWLFGSFKADNHARHLRLSGDQRAFDGSLRYFEADLDGAAPFSLEFFIDQPQYVKISYTRNELKLFVEPGDTIFLDIDPMNFTYNSSLSGINGRKNKIVNNYYQNSEQAARLSERLQFKYGNLWYHTNIYKDVWMRELESTDFLTKMNAWKKSGQEFLFDMMQKHPKAFSGKLETYLSAEINYDWAYHLLIYGSTYGNRHELSSDFLDFMGLIPLNGPCAASPFYRKYVFARINYLHETTAPDQDYLTDMLARADSLLEGEIRAWFLSELFIKNLEERAKSDFIDYYYNFLNETDFPAYGQRLFYKMQELLPLTVGHLAPKFHLESYDGNKFDNSDFLSKPVLIAFWASWCRPCLDKMSRLREIHEIYGQRLQLVLFNLDENETSWRQASQKYNTPAINLFVPKSERETLLNAFGVKFLPGLLLLDEKGRFAIPAGQIQLEQPDRWIP